MSTRTTAPAGGRRFWVTVLCFAIANAAVWVGYIQWQKIHRHHLLEITQFSPGDGALVDGRPTLCWSFNMDVAAFAPNNPPPGLIEPTIAGKWELSDPRTLKFTPDSALPRATPINVTLNADALHTPDGFRLAKPYVAALHTARCRFWKRRQISYDDNNRVTLKLTFNDKVLPADVLKYLTLRGSSGKPIPFHANGDAAGKIVHVMTDPLSPGELNGTSSDLSLDLRIAKGLAGESGPLGLETDYNERSTEHCAGSGGDRRPWPISLRTMMRSSKFGLTTRSIRMRSSRCCRFRRPFRSRWLRGTTASTCMAHSSQARGTQSSWQRPPPGQSRGKCPGRHRSACLFPIEVRASGLKVKWDISAPREIGPFSPTSST